MGVVRFAVRQFREAPDKRRFLRSVALGSRGGNRTVTSADGTSLSVRVSGAGVPVVLVHGTLDGIGAFSMIELQLAAQHQVWVYDRRGRGGSGDADRYSIGREVDDLRAVIAATGRAPHVVGHSYGAVIALRAGLAGADMRSLTVYEPPINAEAIRPDDVDEIRSAVDDGRTEHAIEVMAKRLAGLSDDELHVAMSVPPVHKRLRDGVRTAPREIDEIRACDWSGLPVTGVPTLVIRGGRDASPAYPTAEQSPGLAVDTEVVTIPGQGHLANVFAPNEFAAAILEFLARH
jgi:pimeloyl-ACP methyl ester carboxylesterase